MKHHVDRETQEQVRKPRKQRRFTKVNVQRRCDGELIDYDGADIIQERVFLDGEPDKNGKKRRVEHAKIRVKAGGIVLIPANEIVGWFPI